uniref:MarR family winged helix-turn-helix transcriptional regulator n=1 Tax=Streptococcus pluranimalium TaxID=82348 RepID=UPI003F693A83
MKTIEDMLAFKLLLAKKAMIDRRIHCEFSALGLTRGNFVTLAIIVQYPGITQSELSQKNLKDKNVIGHLVDKLEEKALVERRKGEKDRRSYQLYATKAGQEMVQTNWDGFFNHGKAVLTENEEKTLLGLLDKLVMEEENSK